MTTRVARSAGIVLLSFLMDAGDDLNRTAKAGLHGTGRARERSRIANEGGVRVQAAVDALNALLSDTALWDMLDGSGPYADDVPVAAINNRLDWSRRTDHTRDDAVDALHTDPPSAA